MYVFDDLQMFFIFFLLSTRKARFSGRVVHAYSLAVGVCQSTLAIGLTNSRSICDTRLVFPKRPAMCLTLFVAS